jgi:hypothetical protein
MEVLAAMCILPRLVKAIITQRFNRFKVALANAEQANIRFHDIGCFDASRDRYPPIDDRLNIDNVQALTDQG